MQLIKAQWLWLNQDLEPVPMGLQVGCALKMPRPQNLSRGRSRPHSRSRCVGLRGLCGVTATRIGGKQFVFD